MGDGAGLRERTRRAVQGELLLVALDLFASQGFESTTVDQIASAAGLSRRSFFRYFGTKEEVLTQTLEALGQELAENLRTRPAAETSWTALRRSFDPLIEQMGAEKRALVMTRLMIDTPALQASHLQKLTSWRRALAEVLEQRAGSDFGDGDRRLEAGAVSGAAVECLVAAQEEWVRTEGARPLGELVDATMDAVGRSARAPDDAQGVARDRP
ncbi:MAG: TetR/AcrR family transcriptional regulator [Janthinobacterium lividum]